MGHYEPLRHYAEVHLLMEPGPRGSGVEIATACREDELAAAGSGSSSPTWRRKPHRPPMGASPLTDAKLTPARAAPTSSTRRAGTSARPPTGRCAKQVDRPCLERPAATLEPWYRFTLRLPQDCLGRALADMPRLCAQFDPPETQGEEAALSGRAPVAPSRGLRPRGSRLATWGGRGQPPPAGLLRPCHNTEEVGGPGG